MPRGGKREGAGRKLSGDAPRVTIAAMVDNTTKTKLQQWKAELGMSLGELIDAIVQDYEERIEKESK